MRINQDQVNTAIDSITESLRINGAASDLTDFLVNYLAANSHDIVELYNQEDEEEDQD
jgi:hypothetical protein